MPVQYAGILQEHRAVRERAGLFDVSHMGQIHLRGRGARASLERLLTCPVASLRVGQVRYGILCHETGGAVDDVTLYRTGEDAYFLCVNASNIEKDHRHVLRYAEDTTEVRDESDATGLLALQGPRCAAVLAELAEPDPRAIRRFRFASGRVAGRPALISRTGYTGSDGFEIYCAGGDTVALWDALVERGRPHGLERGGFVGAEALCRQRERGVSKRLAGFVVEGRGVARAEHALAHAGREVGRVTSGAPSPTLGKSIGLGYVPPALAEAGTELAVMIRGQAVAARVVRTPFVGKD